MSPTLSSLSISLIFLAGLAAFAYGRWRHDLIALAMLAIAIILGIVEPRDAFTGFSDPVVITVACVMIISAAISRSGVLVHMLRPFSRLLSREFGIALVFSMLCGLASSFMNNVGALALLLPAALTTCRSAGVSPSRVLMPMAFSSLLGGLVTMIGTPPNVILAELRSHYHPDGFSMFDFTPVGLPLAVAGIVMSVLLARFLPDRGAAAAEALHFRIADYLFEIRIPDRKALADLTVRDLTEEAHEGDRLAVHAIDRGGILLAAPAGYRELRAGDIVQVEGRAPVVEAIIQKFGLELASDTEDDLLESSFVEYVVSERSQLAENPFGVQVLAQAGAALTAISRRGRNIISGLSDIVIQSGDIVLLQVPNERRADISTRFSLFPLADRHISLKPTLTDWLPVSGLLLAVGAASMGWQPLAITLVLAILLLGVTSRLPANLYRDVDWSIISLLALLIPVAQAFEKSGTGEAVAAILTSLGSGFPDWAMIGAVLAITMAVTPFLNNAAAVLIMGPIAATTAVAGHISVDAMLMAVAVGASCDFLTPIGHQSNTLVWGPGNYRFGDYARIGFPISIVILAFGTWLITYFWS